jgi:uncharacterized protein (TIGR03437 family)
MSFVRNKLVLLAFSFAWAAAAQECRWTPVTPAQPPLLRDEGEKATESQTFQTTAFALSPSNQAYIFDTASRIRRIEPDGRIRTVAGNGVRTETVTAGNALANGLPAVSQIVFSREGVLHFVATGRVFRIVDGLIEPVAGSGKPGFNGEERAALELNLGTIAHVAFDYNGEMMIVDGYNRVRRLAADGMLRTIAGSTRAAASAGLTGDNGPAVNASLSSPRQVVPFSDGSYWIKDLSGRHVRLVTPDGIIRTINQAFEPTMTILRLPDDRPAGATSNRVYPLLDNAVIERGGNPFAPFTGSPLGVGTDGSLYYLGNTRPEQRNPLIRMTGSVQTVIAGAPVAAVVDGQAPPFGVWNPRTNTLLYATSVGGRFGILEARPGQQARFVLGGGDDNGDPDGKSATQLTMFGILAFSVDAEGRLAVADVYRRRLLVVGSDGKVAVLKNAAGEAVIYAPLGSFSNLQRIAADSAGNIYWYQQGATPAGGVFTADIAVWERATAKIGVHTVTGLSALGRLEDGTVFVISGNATNFRSARQFTPAGVGELLPWYRLPLTSVTRLRNTSYFTAATRLFRGEQPNIQMLDLTALPNGAVFNPDFAISGQGSLYVHLGDGGFYRLEDPEACVWMAQPAVRPGGVVNAASLEFEDTISPRQLLTIRGTGLGPAGGQGMIQDGLLRAVGQAAPYPSLVMGNFSGSIPEATLSGTTLPVLYSDDKEVTVQGPSGTPVSGTYLLYFTWQGLQLIQQPTVQVTPAAPGLFTVNGRRDGPAVAANEDGSRNGPENPAISGSVVQLLGTGFGAIDRNLAMGEFFPADPVRHTGVVTATIGGEEAEVVFAGGVPGELGGTTQIQVRVPEGLAPGEHRVILRLENQTVDAAQNATLFLK